MAVELKSYNEILGQLVRKIIADTSVNDLATGSVLLTLLEAVAANDFDNSTSILSVLETLNIDAIRNQDLDARAADYGLSRSPSQRATGFIKISDSNITKRATSLYAVKPPPIAGSSIIYVNSAAGWSPTGDLYIGRGTQQFEGPISYTSIVNNGSFYTITLGSSLQKDHLISDSVIDSQGNADRLIKAGTLVSIPANNQSPEIRYTTLRDAVLAAGEDSVGNIGIVAQIAGVRSNASINTIIAFVNSPFTGATVSNTSVLSDGADAESDDDLRERIKSYSSTLARGTKDAILSAILNVSDATDGKQVASAVITEPAEIGDPSIVYIDDGSGFQPSYSGQPLDVLLGSATGNEEFLQLANFPLPRPQIINSAEGPYQITNGMKLRVKTDILEEEVTFTTSQFLNIAAATLPEVVVAINDQAINFRARLTENSSRLLLSPVGDKTEVIQVAPIRDGELLSVYANSIFKFPTNEYSYIKLYRNNTLLRSTLRSATISSSTFASWAITGPGNLVLQVDGTPAQDVTFTTLDFGGNALSSLDINDWVAAFNAKYAGITSTATSSGTVTFVSNRDGAASSIAAIGGSYITQMFGTSVTSDVGLNSDFALNRQTGNLQLNFKPDVGDTIVAGNTDAKGFFTSSESNTGTFNLSSDSQSRASQLVLSVDGSADVRQGVLFAQGNTITVQDMGSGVMRVIGNTLKSFAAAQLGDYLWITNRGDVGGGGSWVAASSSGIYKILKKGDHLTAGSDTWVEVYNDSIVAGGPYSVQDTADISVFESKSYPQVWKASSLTTPAAATLQSIVDSITKEIANIKASVFKTNTVKTSSSTEEDGSIGLPVSVGRGASIFAKTLVEQLGNPTHTATKTSDRDLFGNPRMGSDSPAFLNRIVYKELVGTLDDGAEPGVEGVDPYSELLSVNASTLNTSSIELDDVLMMGKANNSKHFRSIKELQAVNDIGTQHELPRTVLDHATGDEVLISRPVSIAADDSAVFVLDKDLVTKTINVNFWRTGKINTQYSASTTAFSADDFDNEPGINFGSPEVWSKTLTGAEFKDYGVLMRSRNWYRTGGAANALGATMILRSKEYGRAGDRFRFRLEYPSAPDQSTIVSHSNTPNNSLVTAILGSGNVRNTAIVGGTTFKVTLTSPNIYRYIFQDLSVDFTPLLPSDVVSISAASGVSAANRGVFSVEAFNAPSRWIEVYNPTGAITSVGQPEISKITAIADVLGTPQVTDVVCTAQGATASTISNSEYFTIYDDIGMVVFWYDIDNAGASAPTVVGASRYVEIATVATGDSAPTVASKTAVVVNSDLKFSATSAGSTATITNAFNGPVTLGVAGPNTGFAVNLVTAGTANTSIGGKYFTLADKDGSVAVWFNVNSEPEPPHGATRSIQVLITAGDSANTVATKVAAQINGDAEYASSAVLSVITITDAVNGVRVNINAGTSGFTSATEFQAGIDDGVETISIASLFQIYPLAENDCQTLTDVISTSQLITAVPVGDASALFTKATRQDTYSYSGNSSALAYDHDPTPANLKHDYVSFWDGYSFVKTYANTNPQFVLKRDMVLPGVVPTIYNMASCPNPSITDVGELFKLVPKTVTNVKHHLSHKALSQLPLVADVDVAGDFRRIQVKSKKLGTDGAVEMVGGRANAAAFELIGDGQLTTQSGVDYTELTVSAFPSSISVGDYIKIKNTLPAKRLSRLISSDKIDVVNTAANTFEYRLMPKLTNSGQFVPWTIADSSGSYSLPAGTVWRWTHAQAGSNTSIVALVNGAVLTSPADYQNNSTPDAPELHIASYTNGTASTAAQFQLTLSTYPSSRSFFAFQTQGGSPVTFAVWFDVSGADALPTGATFAATTHKIRVDVSGTAIADGAIAALQAALIGNANFTANFTSTQTSAMTLANINAGDLVVARPLSAYAIGGFLDRWSNGNTVSAAGDEKVSGLPIIAVNAASRYVDVLNPIGKAMSADFTGFDGQLDFLPATTIKWNLGHKSRVQVTSVVLAGGTATVITNGEHGLSVGDSFLLEGISTSPSVDGTYTVVDTLSNISFTFALAGTASYVGGVVTKDTVSDVTRYRVEKMGLNNLFRYRRVSGPSPRFVDFGVAVDDYALISGTTFLSQNTGRFRIRALSNDHIVVENSTGTEQLHGVTAFNEEQLTVAWVGAATTVTGTRSAFRRVTVGSWIKKIEDNDTYFTQVLSITGGTNPADAVTVTLAQPYPGLSGASKGVLLEQDTGAEAGVSLVSSNDLQVLEGDAAFSGDSLVVENIVNQNWFNTSNSGVRAITAVGSSLSDHTQFLRVTNAGGIAETSRLVSVKLNGFYILEDGDHTYETNKLVHHSVISSSNSSRRTVYTKPSDRTYKLSDLYQSAVTVEGKIGMDVSVTTGVDGYSYYTGLMQTVQRIIDGFEPDPSNYPGRRAVGSIIEALPPLIRSVALSLNITTRDGVNLTDITNDIKSAVITYVSSLGVGEDVILSEIIARTMAISGVAAVTFTSPVPSTERIAIADDAKAFVSPESISIS